MSKIILCRGIQGSGKTTWAKQYASIFETYVIYDGSMGRADKVKSMYRYSK